VSGLIGPGDRKSIQPMAERLERLVGGSDAVLVIDEARIQLVSLRNKLRRWARPPTARPWYR
jgi:hypothetical protein